MIAGVSVVCAVGPWLFTEPLVLRGLAAGAALTTVVGAVVMRRWDAAAGKRVADLTRARASDEWRYEERVAELETDLEESRELRTKLEQRLRAKRAELAKLRNEHAALLRRYATAETERASALEGRRLLEIETTTPARALPAPQPPTPAARETPDAARNAAARADVRPPEDVTDVPDVTDATAPAGAEPERGAVSGAPAPGAFSPDGSALFLRAGSALARLAEDEGAAAERAATDVPAATPASDARETTASEATEETASTEDGDPAEATASAMDARDGDAGDATAPAEDGEAADTTASVEDDGAAEAPDTAARDKASPEARTTPVISALSALSAKSSPKKGGPGDGGGTKRPTAEPDAPGVHAGEEGEAEGKPVAVAERQDAAAPTHQQPQPVVTKPAHATGHFTVPTAVAVVPAAPRRRQAAEGGFDFFGTQKPRQDLESVQNEDLADVVGQEALAVHKEEAESGFKPADPEARAVSQIIDLTAHDETEQIDVQGLRTAAS